MTYEFPDFINDHKSQLTVSDIPEYLWYGLYVKLNDELYDIGDHCELKLNSDESNVECCVNKPLMASDGTNIFLIDHSWSFELDNMKAILKTNANIRERVSAMVGIDTEDAEVDDVCDAVMDNIWSRLRYYDITLKNPEKRTKIWYMIDEVGNFLKHEPVTPNMKICPFMYAKTGLCVSVAWLIKDVQREDSLSIDMSAHITDPYLKKCLSYVWNKKLPNKDLVSQYGHSLSSEFFLSHRVQESHPDLLSNEQLGQIDRDKLTLKVYSDLVFVQNHLTHPNFEITDKEEEAGILWYYDHFKEFEKLSREKPRVMVNQFPSESVLTTKDLLAALGSENTWLPQTFNLKTELAQFMNYFVELKENNNSSENEECIANCPCNCHILNVDCGVCVEDKTCRSIKNDIDPVWIVKPWNLARGLGIFISQNLDHILRMVEAFPSEPKIASRYIADPVLFYRTDLSVNVKFDIRYMILLSSVDPLKVYVTKVFWLRFANKQFQLNDWSDYEMHFTVMNYRGESELKNIVCDEFVNLFDSQYPENKWSSVENKIHNCLRDLITDVTRRSDPLRIRPSPQSRAMYAVDLMLEWTYDNDNQPNIRPQICEVNYCPDCTRACQYHPDFFNDVFNTLFLDQPTNVIQLV